MTNDNTFA